MAPAPVILLLLLLTLSVSLSSLHPAASSDPSSADELAALLALKGSVTLDPSSLLSGWDPSAAAPAATAGGAASPAPPPPAASPPSTSPAAPSPEPFPPPCSASPSSAPSPSPETPSLIPVEISFLPSLRVLDLSYNSLSGLIPENLIGSSRIESLDLSFNRLTGGIKIVPSGSCRFLSHLKLSGNLLIDSIPSEIGKCSNLRDLLLDRNILEGHIPAQLGWLSRLRVLDVSRNSLTDRIPKELGNCRELSVLVLTDLMDIDSMTSRSSMVSSSSGEEFNAFVGAIPPEVVSISSLEILWAPRANLDGKLPSYRNSSCSLRILNLGQNYISGMIPEWLGMCQNLTFLDLSSNYLQGPVPFSVRFGCMVYFNVSRNSLSGSAMKSTESGCSNSLFSDGENIGFSVREGVLMQYYESFLQSASKGNPFGSILGEDLVVLHDFSWNGFSGSLPSFSLALHSNFSYGLLLNNNAFDGSLSSAFFGFCDGGSGLAVNLSVNRISGIIEPLTGCLFLRSFEAANNQFSGPISSNIKGLHLLKHLDLRWNNLSGEIPVQIGNLASLTFLDLSRNSLIGSIPSSLSDAPNLQILLLDHNRLSGNIPRNFSSLTQLMTLDVSFNNLSGTIPYLRHSNDCKFFEGNRFLQPCVSLNASSQSENPIQDDAKKWNSRKTRLKSFIMAAVASVCIILSILLVLFLVLIYGKRKHVKIASARRKMVVTFMDAAPELTYDNVVQATGNFSIQNLIGTGGFGATYKAELVPGFSVAVKRLSIGKFQGLRQFDAEIRTLGRIRHKNLVTLIGYHRGESDTFLIYNYLSGGNLEAFIRNMANRKMSWVEIHKIALDVAQALAYLHYSCIPRIVHRDIKPSNILLDEKLNAYLSDFGLARLLEASETHATTDVAGTFGYVAPEYATTCRVSDKSDVYSFGVVLMELMSGKRSLDPSFSQYGNGFTVVAWGRMLAQEERAGEFFDSGLWEAGPKENLVEMLRLGLSCTVESLTVRPSMKHVVAALKQLKN
uniref:non-specific serine/threonine protein kinase n=1 Tax=Ananas comosus var. bracteatus TaxID=296719 RepID=A0A6V7P0H2_ANACO|nr:unnamed protein product [Ananas comosus var. bracteatus]